MVIIKEEGKTSVGEALEDLEPSWFAGGNVKWCSPCGKLFGGFSAIPFLSIKKN